MQIVSSQKEMNWAMKDWTYKTLESNYDPPEDKEVRDSLDDWLQEHADQVIQTKLWKTWAVITGWD